MGTHYLVLGTLSVMAVFWPLDKVKLGNTFCFELQKIADITGLKFVALKAFEEWAAIPTVFASPLHLWLRNKCKMPAEMPSLGLLQTGPAVPLLVHAADQGFWHLKGSTISRLLNEEFSIEQSPGATEASSLVQAVRACKKCDEFAAATVLAARCDAAADDDVLNLLADDLVQEAVPVEDRKEINTWLESQRGDKIFACEMSSEIVSIRMKSKKVVKRKPIGIPNKSTFSHDDALATMPPNAKVLRDVFNGRWRVYLGKWNRSKSWGWNGSDMHCVSALSHAAWQHHCAITGEQSPFAAVA